MTKYDFAAAYLDNLVLLFLLTRMQTWIAAVDENGHKLRRAWGPPVHLVDEKGQSFEAVERSWTKTDIPLRERADTCGIPFENIRATLGVTT